MVMDLRSICPFVAILAILALILVPNSLAQENNSCDSVAGSWEMVSQKATYSDSVGETDISKEKSLRIMSATHWVFVRKNAETNEFVGGGGGRHRISGNKYTVIRDYHSYSIMSVGSETTYDCRIEDNLLYLSGKVNDELLLLEEVWRRIE
jgi:hypothetical protein